MSRNNIRHGVALAAGDFQGRAQIHQAAALGVDRHPAPVRRAKLRQHLMVGGQPGRMQLRVAAAEPDHLAGRQLAIAQRAKAHHLHAAARQQRQVIGVIKIEGLIVGEGQRQSFAGVGGKLFSPLADRHGGQFAEGQQPVYVEGAPQQAGKIPPCLLIDHRLAGGHQSQMSFGQRHAFHARHIAEHWHLTVALNGAFQQLEVRVAVDPIDDNASDVESRIKMLKTHHRGGDGGRHRFAIHQQNHRAAKLLSHCRAAAVVGVGAVAVIQAHHPFDNRDIGLL